MNMRRFFFPPVFADEEQTRVARLLHILLCSIMLVVTGTEIIGMFVLPANWLRWLTIILTIDGINLVLIMVNHRGRTRAASIFFLIEIWTVATFLALSAGGIRAPATNTYFIMVLAAGLLLSERAGIIAGFLCVVTGLGLVLLETFGRLPANTVQHTALSLWITQILFIGLIMSLQFLTTRSIRTSLHKAQRELAERQRTESALRANEERYRSLVVATAQVVWTTDADGQVIDDLPTWREFTGQQTHETMGRGWLNALHPDDRQKTSEIWAHAVKTRSIYDTEYRLRRADGEWRHVSVRGVPVIEKDGRIREWVGSCRDITERKIAEDEIKSLNENLEHRVRERTEQLNAINKGLESFAYSVSHDLRSPLHTITGFARVLKEDYPDRLDQAAQHHLDRIIHAGQRMGYLIEDLLKYSRIGLAIELQPINLDELLRQIARDFSLRIKSIGGSLTLPPDLPVVSGAPTLLTQIFSNLFENSINYRKKDIPLQLSITCRKEPDYAVIGVSDNGIGIAPANHEKIFKVFQRLHSQEEYPGTGIGLANVKKSVEMSGGQVWVESEAGQGSTFFVKLKLANT